MLWRKRHYINIIYIFTTLLILQILVMIWEKFNDVIWGGFPVIIHWPPINANIECYSEVANDALISVEDPSFSPKSNSIFFHETSCRGGIDSRQACAVEAAARVHPDWEVYLLFTAPVTDFMLKWSCLVKLLEFPNIKVARIHVKSYSKNTVVEPLISHRLSSLRVVQQTADIMKMLTLNKWGGVNLDLDVLAMKSFNDLPSNWIAKESPFLLGSGVMRFSKDEVGQNLTSDVLREIHSTFNNKSWFTNGALAIERVLQRRCKKLLTSYKTENCGGIFIFNEKKFYPISIPNAPFLLSGPEAQINGDPYTLCTWDKLSNFHELDQNSKYVKIAKMVCPTIYETFDDKFGV